ncbi:MAG: formylglycine-generating enzyme family protein, partial [Chloroflexi bacterium]|nr:formylglycine-generating enzyme family protein [Chloroflexota bacterium]
FDMAGNVWEWCSTVWDKEAYPFQVNEEWTGDYLRTNVPRVLRGGAFLDDASNVRCAARFGDGPGSGSGNSGFRVVRPPSAASEI